MSKLVKNTTVPWTNILNKSAWYTSYKEIDPLSDEGDIKRYIFMPNDAHGPGLSTALVNAYNLAMVQYLVENWSGFQIMIRVGEAAGQEVNRPYVEIIPLRSTTWE